MEFLGRHKWGIVSKRGGLAARRALLRAGLSFIGLLLEDFGRVGLHD